MSEVHLLQLVVDIELVKLRAFSLLTCICGKTLQQEVRYIALIKQELEISKGVVAKRNILSAFDLLSFLPIMGRSKYESLKVVNSDN